MNLKRLIAIVISWAQKAVESALVHLDVISISSANWKLFYNQHRRFFRYMFTLIFVVIEGLLKRL